MKVIKQPPPTNKSLVKNIINILTIDVEDWFHILDIPSQPPLQEWINLESRVVKNTLQILDLLNFHQKKATFFILGWVAQHFPDLVREIDRQGHEIASHGYSHQLIYKLTPEEFYQDINLSLEFLSKTTNQPILGYRAPGFSLNSNTMWALDILIKLGFSYDASVFPTKSYCSDVEECYQEGKWLETPKGNRILEISVTPITFFGKKIYLLGGGYFRLAPYWAISSSITLLNRQCKPALVYLHPREIDPVHPRLAMNQFRSFKSYVNLQTTHKKFARMLTEFQFSSINRVRSLSSLSSHCV